jgi:hypothetical protein
MGNEKRADSEYGIAYLYGLPLAIDIVDAWQY